MVMITEEELNMILKERERKAKETERIANIDKACDMILNGFKLLTENGGTLTLRGGGYTQVCQRILSIERDYNGLRLNERK